MRLSANVAVVQWLRMQVLGMEVPGLNSGKKFKNSAFFVHLIYLMVTALLEYVSQFRAFTLIWFLLYDFLAITLLLFKIFQKALLRWSAYLLSIFQVIPILGLLYSYDRS